MREHSGFIMTSTGTPIQNGDDD